jgi:hypothetical protein
VRKAPAWPLVFIVLAFLALAGAISVVNPLFEATDEIRHYRYVRHLAVRGALPVQGAEMVRSQSHHPPLYYALCALASAWVPSSHSPEYEQPLNPFWGYRNWEVGVDNKLQYLHSPAERFPFRQGYLAALIPRWVNVLLGAATVGLTWLLGRQVWPGRPQLAWGAAALVAFNPQFLYLSGAINNDVIAATMGTAVLLLSVQVAQGANDRRRLVLLGLAFGLALLAKFHLLILGGVIVLALILSLRVRRDGPRRASCQLALQMGVVLGVAAILSGWWFLRNWQLYGDPTGLNKVNELWMGRPASGNWWALRQGLPYLWSSLWARFGYGQIPLPASIYQGLLVLCLLALIGYLFPRHSVFGIRYSVFGILLVTVLGFTAVVCYYILIQPAGPMGRFLFPALPALAILLLGGLDRWPLLRERPTWAAWGVGLGMLALALVALGGYLWPAVRYPPQAKSAPRPRPEPVEGSRFQLGDVARVRSVDLHPAVLLPGEPLFVTVVWEPLRTTERPYAVYVHLIDQAGALVAQRDTWPGLGRAPTTAWRPGQPFADIYRVDLPATTYTPNQATVPLARL